MYPVIESAALRAGVILKSRGVCDLGRENIFTGELYMLNHKKISISFISFILLFAVFCAMSSPAGAMTLKEVRYLADQNNPAAQFTMGLLYEKGEQGLAQDMVEARKWYEKAAHANVYARNRLAVMYYQGLGGLERDVPKTIKLLEQSVAQNSDVAQFMLGSIYYNGAEGVTVDKVKARELFEKAARRGNAQAQDTLGVMYYNGEGGLVKDPAQALKWYEKAADQNFSQGNLHMAAMYYDGQGGLDVDREKAVELMKKAADSGNKLAAGLLESWQRASKPKELELKISGHGNINDSPPPFKEGLHGFADSKQKKDMEKAAADSSPEVTDSEK